MVIIPSLQQSITALFFTLAAVTNAVDSGRILFTGLSTQDSTVFIQHTHSHRGIFAHPRAIKPRENKDQEQEAPYVVAWLETLVPLKPITRQPVHCSGSPEAC